MNLLQTISINTYTLISLKKRVRILKSYFETHLFGGESSEISSEDHTWLSSLPPDLFSLFNKENLNATFDELNTQIENLKPLVLYVVFDLPDDQLAAIGQNLRQSLNKLLFLDVKKDPNLIAGAAFVYNGVYKDYSLKAQIEANREKILLEFKRSLE